MRWRISLRFLFIIVLSTIIIVYINLYVFHRLFISDMDAGDPWDQPTTFTLDFNQYIVKGENGRPVVKEEGLKELENRRAWIQILDEEGYEIYHWNKPEEALTRYTPGNMIHYHVYSGVIEGYTIFVGTEEDENYQWSYIIGFPIEKVAKYTLYFSPEDLKTTILKTGIIFIIVPILVFTVMGYVFGRSLTVPIIEVLQGIQRLSEGKYDKSYEERGLYKEVYSSLNNLSNTLKSNEIERQRTEEMREEWIHNLSHDLKTPLASVKGYGELLTDEKYSLTEKESKKYSHIILEKAKYMEKLLEDLKLTQVLKRGLIPLNCQNEDLIEVLREVIISILNNPHYQNRKIHFNEKQDKIIFNFDKDLMIRAFTNLIYNGIVHNDENTEIFITIDKQDKIYIEIEDNGRGISPGDLDNLFERYYRGTNTGESHKGSGLGMAIAKQIIELHNGSIKVESTLGVGTKIAIIFEFTEGRF